MVRSEQGVSCVGGRKKKRQGKQQLGRERGRSHGHKHKSKETEIENQSKKVGLVGVLG